MKPAPNNPKLFWTCYLVGTFGPIPGRFLLGFWDKRVKDNVGFSSFSLPWLFGTILLIYCVWSVRKILLRNPGLGQHLWLYRIFGWLALIESFVWASVLLGVL